MTASDPSAVETSPSSYPSRDDHRRAGADPSRANSEEPADVIASAVMAEADLRPVVVEDGPEPETADDGPSISAIEALAHFKLPKAPTILARLTSVTNSFANSIIPAVKPTETEVQQVLDILGMGDGAVCSYCGDPATEWDHFRPVVVDKRPTGYITEINNLVPACGKCNQSKGNKHWREWMEGSADRSPTTRQVDGLAGKIQRLQDYEDWSQPTQLDLAQIVGRDVWDEYWASWVEIRERLTRATAIASHVQQLVAAAHAQGVVESLDEQTVESQESQDQLVEPPGVGAWVIRTPAGMIQAETKTEAARLIVTSVIQAGLDPYAVEGALGSSAIRSVAGIITDPDELWHTFATAHGKESKHRRLWHLGHPVHAASRTWLVANNVWDKRTPARLKTIVDMTRGRVSFIPPEGAPPEVTP